MYTQHIVLNNQHTHCQATNTTDELDKMMNISNEELSLFLLEHYDDGNFAQAYKHYKKQKNGTV
ncbi:hypothetical protein UA38_10570 [Photobacterium kishitanii]|uniref:Uncharacterized protein n=1 Tax=Photobacterium kishitanii TaxID=318456 RepID=A0AAX0YQ05_9GAMM|nr:hypothetical protein [Photobacterium kishitanii]KJG09412.1 hypothetical protein UB40_12855 [Photobacterium kishitanii]KJG57410.1 hypothetical protein UA38_10570 [Photobacterium kishitanii]KJG65160.1 hypothetical protein UA40_13115 [Photobacterium kishitanii]OBU33661.1 hypothetical protein AYY23_14145 [Photobacterium kishitanii]PSU19269.1 hypothetical protein CTM84_16995 [Photobacterium kishitanii]